MIERILSQSRLVAMAVILAINPSLAVSADNCSEVPVCVRAHRSAWERRLRQSG
jgi:hypothetical protein